MEDEWDVPSCRETGIRLSELAIDGTVRSCLPILQIRLFVFDKPSTSG
jgi:hypothetical protein